MFTLSRYTKQIILIALASLLLFAACGGGEPTATPAPTPAPTNTATAVPNTPTAVPPTATTTTQPKPATTTVSATSAPTMTGKITQTTSVTTSKSVTASQSVTASKAGTQPAAPVSPLSKPVSPLATPAAAPSGVVPASKPGTASVAGRLISKITGQPLDHVVVRLAEIYCPSGVGKAVVRSKCVWSLDDAFSPSTFTDANGYFVFMDVHPRDYIVLIGNMVMKYAIIKDNQNQPMMWTADANKIVKIGEFTVDY